MRVDDVPESASGGCKTNHLAFYRLDPRRRQGGAAAQPHKRRPGSGGKYRVLGVNSSRGRLYARYTAILYVEAVDACVLENVDRVELGVSGEGRDELSIVHLPVIWE